MLWCARATRFVGIPGAQLSAGAARRAHMAYAWTTRAPLALELERISGPPGAAESALIDIIPKYYESISHRRSAARMRKLLKTCICQTYKKTEEVPQ